MVRPELIIHWLGRVARALGLLQDAVSCDIRDEGRPKISSVLESQGRRQGKHIHIFNLDSGQALTKFLQGLLKFSQTDKVRTKPIPKYTPPEKTGTPSDRPLAERKPSGPVGPLRITMKQFNLLPPPLSTPPVIVAPEPAPQPEKKSLKLKLNFMKKPSDAGGGT